MSRYRRHVFICCNQKEEGKKSCGEHHGMQLVNELRGLLEAEGINAKSDIRVQKSGCLGVCKHGPAMVVYPEGTFYGAVSSERLKDIAQHHLINGQPVTDWMIDEQ